MYKLPEMGGGGGGRGNSGNVRKETFFFQEVFPKADTTCGDPEIRLRGIERERGNARRGEMTICWHKIHLLIQIVIYLLNCETGSVNDLQP